FPALLEIRTALRRHDLRAVNLQYPTHAYGRIPAVALVPTLLRRSLRLPVVSTLHEFTTFGPSGRWRVSRLAHTSSAAIVPDRAPSHPSYARYHHLVRERIERSTVRARFHWTGYLEAADVSLRLTAADLVALPYADGASLRLTTLLTALAHRLPVITTGLEA